MGGGGSTKSTGVTEVKLPPWVDAAAQRILKRAEIVSNQPYEMYPAARLAPFNADQQAAFNLTRMMAPQFGRSASNAMLQGGAPQIAGGVPSLSGAIPAPTGSQPVGSQSSRLSPMPSAGGGDVLTNLAEMMGTGGQPASGPKLSTAQLLQQIFGPAGAGMTDQPFDPFTYGQSGGEYEFMRSSGGPLHEVVGGGSGIVLPGPGGGAGAPGSEMITTNDGVQMTQAEWEAYQNRWNTGAFNNPGGGTGDGTGLGSPGGVRGPAAGPGSQGGY